MAVNVWFAAQGTKMISGLFSFPRPNVTEAANKGFYGLVEGKKW